MPYYLVTHTSLVEAKDEEAAARVVLEKIRSGEATEFLVKFDDAHVRRIVLSIAAGPQSTDRPDALPTPLATSLIETEVIDPPDTATAILKADGLSRKLALAFGFTFAAGVVFGLAVGRLFA